MELEKIEGNKSSHGGLRLGSGRPKGATNKTTRTMREGLITVFNEICGIERMRESATKNDENLGQFYRLCARLVPTEPKTHKDENGDVHINILTSIKDDED